MFALAVFSYFYISIKNNDFFDFRAIFLAAWLVSFALNLIRLNPIYNELSLKTSIVLIITPVMLLVGSFLYEIMHNNQTEEKVKPKKLMDGKMFFTVSLLISLFILVCFAAESIIIGELPYFSSDMNAYVTFYVSGLHQFVVLSYFIPCLAIIYIHQYGEKWHSPKALLLIALGIIIRGETYHFELVSNESGAGVTRVGLDFNIPIANAILTTENDDQAIARMNIKGEDAAVVAVEMANLLTTIHNTDAAE